MIMNNGVFCAGWTILGNRPEGRFVRIAIYASVLICAFVLPGQTRPSGPIVQHKQQAPVFCGWIGVRLSPMTRAFADSLGMVESYGAIFGQPKPGSPAAQAGIEAGDVITAINGASLMRSRDFAMMISKRAPGSVIYLTTFRNGELMRRRVTLAYSNCKPRSGAHRNSKT
jgi:C-terminal processing protease CtpA/Prc